MPRELTKAEQRRRPGARRAPPATSSASTPAPSPRPRTWRTSSTRSPPSAQRQGDLEDIVLEVMERAGSRAEPASPSSTEQRAERVARIDELTAARDAAYDRDRRPRPPPWPRRARHRRRRSAPSWSRSTRRSAPQQAASAPAALHQRRCEGCRLELNHRRASTRIRAAADDEVLRCEECRRILVRTAESGL